MANERIVSPGVFTRERDLSFLTQGISEIGGAFIGPTPKGPAFIPTIVRGQQEYVTRFGDADAQHYTGLTTKNYLRESGVATVVRVLGTEGYDNDTTVPSVLYATGSVGKKLFAVLHPSSIGNSLTYTSASGTGDSFFIAVSSSAGLNVTQSALSTDEASTAYFGDYFGFDTTTKKNSYIYAIFPEAVLQAAPTASTTASLSVATQSLSFADVDSDMDYVGSYTSFRKFQISSSILPNAKLADLEAIDISGSGADLNNALLTQFTKYSATTGVITFIVSSSANAVLNSVTYPLLDSYIRTTVKIVAETSSAALNFKNVGYSHAATPWIQSQTIGSQNVDMFKLHTLGDGNSSNKEIKVSFLNIKKSDDVDYNWGTFSMLIRRYDDTDARIEVLEQYDNLTLDPDSSNYIARVIGNSAPTEDVVTGEMYYQGDFPNRSQYIWCEMSDALIPEAAVPFGFAAYNSTVTLSSGNLTTPSYTTSRWKTGDVSGYSVEAVDKRLYYGWDFTDIEGTNPSYLAPIPSPASTVSVGAAFNLEDIVDVPVPNSETATAITLDSAAALPYRRFSVAFQGGFDGLNPARDINLGGDITPTNTQGFNLQNSTSNGSAAYIKALNALSNPDQWDFNLLVLPGVIYEHHSFVANAALTLCEDRGDAFYLMDTVGLNATLATATGKAAEIDSNYAATYYPWLRVIDTNTNKLLWVPPSVILPEIYAYNDNVAAEWFAPAGLNRGGIASAVGVKVRLPQASRDTLYEGKVNPIAQFPGQGICVWGQKTLQRRASALDRVNVRRLLIAVKKYIASASRYLVFEQNVESTRNRFLNIVNPYLASVQERSGLFAFRVIMDETNNTPDVIDRNILYGQLYLQPTRTAEFIVLDFNVLPTGATFPNA
jgi:hypothetical protein